MAEGAVCLHDVISRLLVRMDPGTVEDFVGLEEIDSMLLEIQPALGLVPRDHGRQCSYRW